MKKFFHRCIDQTRQLRWRLTLSYTGVTVGALLVLLLMAGSYFFGYAVVPDFFLSPESWARLANANAVPTIRTIIKQSPDLVSLWTSSLNNTLTDQVLFRAGDVEFRVRTVAQMDILILDAHGGLLGISDPGLIPSAVIGEPLDASLLPGLEQVIGAALAGEEDLDPRVHILEPDHSYVVALPVFDDVGPGDILGVMVAYVASVPAGPDALAHSIQVAGRGLFLFLFSAGILGAFFGFLTAKGMTGRIHKLSHATSAWSKGDFSKTIDDSTGDEISQLGEQLNRMAARLGGLLQKRKEMAIADERNRLARDLHDSAKQQALAASFQLGTAITLFKRDPREAMEHLAEADKLVNAVREELTDLIYELRPLKNGDQDLAVVLQRYAVEWAQQNNIRVEVCEGGQGKTSLENKRALYRILQEALANASRHSQAESITIALSYTEDAVLLVVADDGCGFDINRNHEGLGLTSMRERAEALHGRLDIESKAGQGTRIKVSLPQVEGERNA